MRLTYRTDLQQLDVVDWPAAANLDDTKLICVAIVCGIPETNGQMDARRTSVAPKYKIIVGGSRHKDTLVFSLRE